MKVLLVARWPVGGIKTYFRYIYGRRTFENVEISLIAPADGLKEFLDTQLPVGRIKLLPVKGDGKSIRARLKVELATGNYDLVHSHGFSASFFVQQVMWKRKVPHIMTAHDVFLPGTFKGGGGWLKKLAMRWLLGSVFRVLSVSQDARNNIYEYFPRLPSKQVKNITNGIDTDFFSKGLARDLRTELNAGHRPIIGFFGRFMAQKGFRQLVQAIEILVNQSPAAMKPLVLTFGWGGFIREDFALIESKGLKDYFIQLPGTNDMPAAIRGVDLVVMPSRWEACPLLPMEVLSCGVPIVGTDCVGLREVLSNTPAKVVSVGNAEQLAVAISEQLQEGGERFFEYQPLALKRFSAHEHAQVLHELYREISGTPPNV
ncbi:glycosyl transferase, group 1 [Cellvibrio sp. BR]|uniref:glycosyltransferase family 4 protein n=1 Tax=Cellvibrio sp. BR TaxID=1134474 RepID=UPI0002601370|nr:glycosyltransferase family 4 protein [Cellvibrio sp. BR]EIK46716.1 glycosyl transferase, group 1 [Cellvibrio sp. BR]